MEIKKKSWKKKYWRKKSHVITFENKHLCKMKEKKKKNAKITP
jgi:hypothetical protein